MASLDLVVIGFKRLRFICPFLLDSTVVYAVFLRLTQRQFLVDLQFFQRIPNIIRIIPITF